MMAFDGFTHITARDVKERFGIKIKRKQKNLFSCSADGFVFIIDAAEPRMLYKIAGMVK